MFQISADKFCPTACKITPSLQHNLYDLAGGPGKFEYLNQHL